MSDKRNIAFAILFSGAALVSFLIVASYVLLMFVAGSDVGFGDSVAVVDVWGEIFYDPAKIAEIEEHRDDDDVKAILVHINSPGGGVMASQALFHALRKTRESKPVVAVMGSLAASGGYYVACAADSIVALEGSITGSIGVIAAYLRTEELFRKIGLEVTVIKAGKYKDVGSQYREMTKEERAYIGELLDNLYSQFLRAVSDGRSIPLDRVRELAEGRLYSGEEALAAGLVDRLGTYEDALYMAAALGGIDGRPRVVRKVKKRPLIERLLGRALPPLPLANEDRISLKYIIP